MNPVILIPSLNPDDLLIDYVDRLIGYGFDKIIVVNDGSSAEYDSYFERVAAYPQCRVLRHEVNRGKGAALKTGMKYYLEHFSGCDGIITGDADGQHSLKDTARLAEMLSERSDALILGSRDFNSKDIPARSRFGNKLTSFIFKLVYGRWLSDTQTGLRAIPDPLVEMYSECEGDRYEYEMNMLIESANKKIPMVEEPIETIYIDDNSSSHFHPIRDSVRIYWLILRNIILYAGSSIFCALLELVVLIILEKVIFSRIDISKTGRFFGIIGEGGIARAISSLANFFINKTVVFKKKGSTASSMGKYILLVIANYVVTYSIVALISTIFGYEPVWIAPIIFVLMFIVTYTVQKAWVFKKSDGER